MKENSVDGYFKDYCPFQAMYKDKEIGPGTKIKLLEGHKNAWEEGLFIVNSQGDLESMAQSEPPYLAEQVLSLDYSPKGWKIVED